MNLSVGAGKREIVIPQDYLEAENFGQIHDPIHARTVILKQNEMYVIVSLELTSLPEDIVEELKNTVQRITGAEKDKVWICAAHSFSSPHFMPEHVLKTPEKIAAGKQYRMNLIRAVSDAVSEAVQNMQDAVLKAGTGKCNIVANRDVESDDGWWVGSGGKGPTDPTVTVLALEGKDGQNIAVIAHYAMQSSVMDQAVLSDGKKPVTSDVAGRTCALVEEKTGGVVLYLIGAAGDQSPIEKAVNDTFKNGKKYRVDLQEKGFEICERLAEKLTDTIEQTIKNTGTPKDIRMEYKNTVIRVPAQKMKGNVHTLIPTHEYIFESDGEREMKIEALRIGKIALLGVRPELNSVTAKEIREHSEFRHTLICTMVNGAAKYMADADSYDRCSYEAMNSPWNKGAAELLREGSIRLLKELL